ncbi:MAG: hypothetical protein J0L73_03580 [Verrucomicrobia bacterium]|nr:hypothetical protein [Verrucomicrobiota bacterium]
MYRPFILTGLAAITLASSCNKPNVLNDERVKLEAEYQRAKDEMRDLDGKLASIQTAPAADGKTLEQRHEEMVKKNKGLEAKVKALSKKCDAAEAALSEIQPRLEAYKAKYVY